MIPAEVMPFVLCSTVVATLIGAFVGFRIGRAYRSDNAARLRDEKNAVVETCHELTVAIHRLVDDDRPSAQDIATAFNAHIRKCVRSDVASLATKLGDVLLAYASGGKP